MQAGHFRLRGSLRTFGRVIVKLTTLHVYKVKREFYRVIGNKSKFDEYSIKCRLLNSRIRAESARDVALFVTNLFKQASAPLGANYEYVPKAADSLEDVRLNVKLIAFYLPQFHPIPENDAWWGRGFTEWTNVSKALPQFLGHYQPHLPGELGFYDLRLPDVMRQQIELAKRYGVHGFCFHHYWFGGKRLLERPVSQFLADPSLDMPFCLCWANENWSRRWDGLEEDVLIAQQHSPKDDIAFIEDILPALSDPRYIKVDGKPLLIVYRANLLPDAKATGERWRDHCRKKGLPEPFLVAARSFDIDDPRPFGFDAAVEFPPHQTAAVEITRRMSIMNPAYQGKIFDYRELADRPVNASEPFLNFRCVMPNWDNEARKPGRGYSFAGSSPAAFAGWLGKACNVAMRQSRPDRRLVFVNAWNEWGEGAHLEPDRRFGYGYLHATANVLRDFGDYREIETLIADNNASFRKSSSVAVVLHLYYDDLFEEILANCYPNVSDFNLFVSVRRDISPARLKVMLRKLPNCYVVALKNVGRDVYPFLHILPLLVQHNYETVCKLHSKRSLHRGDGDMLRHNAFRSLVGDRATVERILSTLREDRSVAAIAPEGAIISLAEGERYAGNEKWLKTLLSRLDKAESTDYSCVKFPGGTMFWARLAAIRPLLDLQLKESDFEPEVGQLDGTLAHAVERLVGVAVRMSKGRLVDTSFLSRRCEPG